MSGRGMCSSTVNHLEDKACPEKSVVIGILTILDMTSMGWPSTVGQLDACPTGDQKVAGSTSPFFDSYVP